MPCRHLTAEDRYESPPAQTSAAARRGKANAKRLKLKTNTPFFKKVKVKEGLMQKWPPALISDQLKHRNARDERDQLMCVRD